MYNEPVILNRVVRVKPYRKCGNGAVGSDRKEQSGKRGEVFQKNEDGTETPLFKAEEPTFKALSKKLHEYSGVPKHVAINKTGETHF